MATMGRLPDYNCWINYFRPLSDGNGMVIVTGMQKSGTTAIAKLLGAAVGESVVSDPLYRLFEKKDMDFRPSLFSGNTTLKELWKKQQHFFNASIVKDPDFVFLIPQVIELFPNAKFVFILREPRSTIRSICNRLGLSGRPCVGDFGQEQVGLAWRDFLAGTHPRIGGNTYIEIMANRWVETARIFLANKERFIRADYEVFQSDKAGSIRHLCYQLGFSELKPFGHLLNKQFQSKGDSGVDLESFFGEETLQTIDEIVFSAVSDLYS